jgi:hypothetical protein
MEETKAKGQSNTHRSDKMAALHKVYRIDLGRAFPPGFSSGSVEIIINTTGVSIFLPTNWKRSQWSCSRRSGRHHLGEAGLAFNTRRDRRRRTSVRGDTWESQSCGRL